MKFVKVLPLFLLAIITACSTEKTFPDYLKILEDEWKETKTSSEEYENANIVKPAMSISGVDETVDFNLDDDKPANDKMSKEENQKLIELLSSEGKPGWFKNMTQMKATNIETRETSSQKDEEQSTQESAQPTKENYEKAPTAVINSLQTKLSKVNDPLASNIKTSLSGLTKKWSSLSDDERKGIQDTLKTITSNFDKFVNAGDNPVGAIQGAIDIIGSIASNFGPQGQLVSMGLGFVSAILGLFGKGPQQPSVSEVVRKVINEALDEYHDQSLTDKAHGVIKALSDSKAYLDGVAKIGKPLNLEQMKLASSRVPIIQGSEFMGELFSVTNRLFTNNLSKDAKKAFKYAELYAKMETLRDLMLTQFISITGKEKNLEFDVEGLMNVRRTVRKGVKVLLKNLYVVSNKNSNILPYFDPDNSPATDSYARTLLDLGKYNRSMAGQYCLIYSNGGDLIWRDAVYSNYQLNGKPYVMALAVHNNANCNWKLVPHGNNIYSIVNKDGCYTKHDKYCDAMLSYDVIDGIPYVGIDQSHPVLWLIEPRDNKFKSIRRYSGCPACADDLRIEKRELFGWACFQEITCTKNVGQLLKRDGKFHWELRRQQNLPMWR